MSANSRSYCGRLRISYGRTALFFFCTGSSIYCYTDSILAVTLTAGGIPSVLYNEFRFHTTG